MYEGLELTRHIKQYSQRQEVDLYNLQMLSGAFNNLLEAGFKHRAAVLAGQQGVSEPAFDELLEAYVVQTKQHEDGGIISEVTTGNTTKTEFKSGTPSPNIFPIMASLCRINTGTAMCDSGGTSGRAWQQAMCEESKEVCYVDKWGCGYISMEHHLAAMLDYTEECHQLQKRFHVHLEMHDPESDWDWFEAVGNFLKSMEKRDKLDYNEPGNTCNSELDIDGGFWYCEFTLDEDGEQYIVIMSHNGADIRGGYTPPYFFKVVGEDYFWDMRLDCCAYGEVTPNNFLPLFNELIPAVTIEHDFDGCYDMHEQCDFVDEEFLEDHGWDIDKPYPYLNRWVYEIRYIEALNADGETYDKIAFPGVPVSMWCAAEGY